MDILNQYVSRGRRTASRIIDGSAIILLLPKNNLDKDDPMFELGPTGTFFWDLLQETPKVSVVVGRFMKKYGVDRKEAVRQVVKFIRDCRSKKLVEVARRRDNKGKPWLT